MESLALAAVVVLLAANIISGLLGARARGKRRQRGAGLADDLPYRTLVAPDAIKLINGGYLAAWEIDAPPASGQTDDAVSEISIRIARAYNSVMDSHCVPHMREAYMPLREYDRPLKYRHPVSRWIDALRWAFFGRGYTYTTRRVLTVAVLPEESKLSRVAAAAEVGREEDGGDPTWARFLDKCADLERVLSQVCRIERLGSYQHRDRSGRERRYNALLEFINYCVSGRRNRIVEPPLGSSINGLISLPFRGGFDVRVGDMETQIVVVGQFPHNTYDLAFERLRELSITYDLVVRFLPLETAQAKNMLNKARAEWERQSSYGNNQQYAAMMIHDVDDARLAVEDGALRFGYASTYVVVRSTSITDAREGAKRIAAALTDIGYPSHVATLTSEDDYFAQLPGNSWAGVRKHPLHTLNMAHIFSLHASSRGRRYVESQTLPDKVCALAYLRAADGVSRRLNLNGDPRDVFGVLGVGGMGRGKSLTISMLAAMWMARMPNPAVVILEKGRSSRRACLFHDGVFLEPLSDSGDAFGLAMFARIEDPDERRFVRQWILDAFTIKGLKVNGAVEETVDAALHAVTTYKPELRNMSAFLGQLQDPTGEYRRVIKLLAKGGPLGRTLDESNDTITFSRWVSVELGPLLRIDDPGAHALVIKALLYRLRAMYRRMREKGEPDLHVLFLIDEAQAILSVPEGAAFVSEMRREARKDQIGIGLFSQQIEHFSQSSIAHDLHDIPVSFWWGNPALKTDTGTLRQQYQEFGCPPDGINRVAELTGYSFGIAERENGAFDVCDWVVDKPTLAVLGRSRPADHALLDQLRAQYPFDWRERLLEREGVSRETIAFLHNALEREGHADRIAAAFSAELTLQNRQDGGEEVVA